MLDLPSTILDTLPDAARTKIERADEARTTAYLVYRHASDEVHEARQNLARAEHLFHAVPAGGRSIDVAAIGQSPNPDVLSADVRAMRRGDEVRGPEPQHITDARRNLARRVEGRERAEAQQAAFGFLAEVERWLGRTATPGGAFRTATVAVPKTRNVVDEISKLRVQLDEIDGLVAKVESIATPKDVLLHRALREIDEVAEMGALRIGVTNRNPKPLGLMEKLTLGSGRLGTSGADIAIWAAQDELKAKVTSLISALPDRDMMSDDEREQAFADLAAKRLLVERREEALIEMAEAQGSVIVRRHNVDPRAFLGIAA